MEKNDGAKADDGSSYLELASLIRGYGATPKKDLQDGNCAYKNHVAHDNAQVVNQFSAKIGYKL